MVLPFGSVYVTSCNTNGRLLQNTVQENDLYSFCWANAPCETNRMMKRRYFNAWVDVLSD